MARIPAIHMYIVRGMGVAERESTSTEVATVFTLSFWRTPNRCSSSTTRSPKFLKMIFGESSACVPTTTSTFPAAMSSRIPCSSAGVRFASDESSSMRTSGMRSRSTRRCCAASTVVGARRPT